jgi:hypothetical protein
MKTFFGERRKFSKGTFKLDLDYTLDEVHDTLALFKPEPTPESFLDKFSYAKAGGEMLEDMLANSLGWRILSGRLAKIFSNCKNTDDIELLSLPEKVLRCHPQLKEYRVLGIKKRVTCVNYEESEILWNSDHTQILSFRHCVLNQGDIPDDLDVFLIAEYPVFPIISAELAMKIAELHPTGFVYEKIVAV